MNLLWYNGIGFNKDFYQDKSFEVFKKNEAHWGMSDDQMKQCFDLLQKGAEKTEEKKKGK